MNLGELLDIPEEAAKMNEATDQDICDAVKERLVDEQMLEINGGDDDDSADQVPRPSRQQALEAVSTLREYISDRNVMFARQLEAMLARFGRQTRLDNMKATRDSQMTDYFSRIAAENHVAATQRRAFLSRADSLDASVRSAGYEHIPVDVHAPILDIPVAADKTKNLMRILSNAVIQGNFALERRDYRNFFTDLIESLSENPKVWGYLPLDVGENATYVPDTTLSQPPFRLFLIGSGTPIEIPQELENLVLIRSRLPYSDFYALMGDMDISLPAFPPNNAYYDAKASSTFTMALECNVPILLTARIRMSYKHVNDDRAVVTRPAAMREVDAVRALRTSDESHFLQRTGTPRGSPTGRAVQKMVRLGWVRSAEDFRGVKEDVWRKNERVVERLLGDMEGLGIEDLEFLVSSIPPMKVVVLIMADCDATASALAPWYTGQRAVVAKVEDIRGSRSDSGIQSAVVGVDGGSSSEESSVPMIRVR
ncbi:hypothetical protein C8J57DRAFT_1511074 [Mycena rebaudengoi]|nr:hypothetical protein C8J57DRAFT_1511074 [Mycena rebaudengoi]